jgi:ATP adenylyltransferase
MITTECPFCKINPAVEILAETTGALAILDSFPVNPGHTLIIPRRHVAGYFDLSEEEQQQLWSLLNTVKEILQHRFHPDGFNVGINVGEMAGQSVMHVHIHLIPRYKGDVPEPRGGVRGVIPGKQKY